MIQKSIWRGIEVDSCKACGLVIHEDELDFCYESRPGSWVAGCPHCSIYFVGNTQEAVINKWNVVTECVAKDMREREMAWEMSGLELLL